MTTHRGEAMTSFGAYGARGQLAVANRSEEGTLRFSILAASPHARAVADCWLSAGEVRALRDFLTDRLERA